MLLPPSPDVCQECAVDHPPEQPHDAQSLHYQYSFYARAGRWPTWKDAVDHCAPDVREHWERELRERGAWTEPESVAPDVMPNDDGTIGSVFKVEPEEG